MRGPQRPRGGFEAETRRDDRHIHTLGRRSRFSTDIYHSLVGMSWPRFFLTFALVFAGINAIFAGLYMLAPGELAGKTEGLPTFARDFFFSVHTLATVGYGNVVPSSLLGNLLVTVEIGCGILLIAVTSGLMFARFSRPSARILFSRVAVITEFDGAPHLMFRAANLRRNYVLEAGARLSVIRQEVHGSQVIRRYHDLPLVRARNPVFSLSWLVMHRIDETSPLFGLDAAQAEADDVELVVVMSGFDMTMAQDIHARNSWTHDAIRWGHAFVDIVSFESGGRRVLDYTRFHDSAPEALRDVPPEA
ncbi:ion channel [Solirhodobacter olei]|uniref:ion channel n=1 Tax=Solirhodobacter olei TaxID=2493082 RepID=UPI000FDC4EA6|nr:ion channel [Solirhodobacter olei]